MIQAAQSLAFLQGGGEMGALTRKKDWSKTPLGHPEYWPQSLRTAVSLILNSQFPMFIWWGKELTTIYNDAYIPVAGEKHPQLLGNAGYLAWAEIWQDLSPLVEKVFAGTATWSEDQPLYMNRYGYTEETYFTFSYSPILDDGGEVNGLFCACIETTKTVQAARRIEQSEQNLRATILQSPVAMAILKGPDFVVEIANKRMYELWGRGAEEMQGLPIFTALPEARNQGLEQLLQKVLTTGQTINASELPVQLPRTEGIKDIYLNFVYEPFRAGDGTISGVIVVATDVSEQVLARQRTEQSEQQVRALVQSAPFPIAAYEGPEMRITLANRSIIDIWGKGDDVIGKLYNEVLPEMEGQHVFDKLQQVLQTGEAYHARNQRLELVVNGKPQTFYFHYSFTPLYDANGNVYGVMNTGADVTDLNLATQKLQQSEQNFRNIILQAPVAMCILTGPDHKIEIANEKILELWGHQEAEVIDRPLFEALPEVKGQGLETLLNQVYQTGEAYHAKERPVMLLRNKTLVPVYQNFVYEPYKDATGKILGVIAISIDVTDQVLTRKKIEDSREALQMAIEIAELGTFSVNLDTNLGKYSNRVLEWFGFDEDEKEMSAIFNTIHPDDKDRVVEAINETVFSPQAPRHDLTYRVINPKDGKTRYLRSTGRALFNETGKGIEIRGIIQDVTPQIEYQQKIEASEALLQQRVLERTLELENLNEELKRSNVNLEEFAYAASHDMKEPIRKILFFSDRLKNELEEQLNDNQKRLFERLEQASRRMGLLIDDLLAYSQATRGMSELENIDLNQKLRNVQVDLELEIDQTKAEIVVDVLPTVRANRRQLQQLFQNLISNALKYRKADSVPKVHISSKLVQGSEARPELPPEEAAKPFYLIEVRDEGIGFEQKDAERIFNVFTRLHGNAEYRGTGVGLAIARKVVENHKGYIWAVSNPDEGATFKILLPAG